MFRKKSPRKRAFLLRFRYLLAIAAGEAALMSGFFALRGTAHLCLAINHPCIQPLECVEVVEKRGL